MTDDTTADPHLAAAGETLRHLNELGANGYGPNAPALIAEAMLEVALAEAITNRIRLLNELLESGLNDEDIVTERARLIDAVVTQPKETP